MKDLIFVFGCDFAYGASEAFVNTVKAKSISEALQKMLDFENKERDDDEKIKDTKEYFEEGFIDVIEIFDFEEDREIANIVIWAYSEFNNLEMLDEFLKEHNKTGKKESLNIQLRKGGYIIA